MRPDASRHHDRALLNCTGVWHTIGGRSLLRSDEGRWLTSLAQTATGRGCSANGTSEAIISSDPMTAGLKKRFITAAEASARHPTIGEMTMLKHLNKTVDDWLADRKMDSHMYVSAHIRPVVCGPIDTKHERRFDVFGKTVNTAAMLTSDGVVLPSELKAMVSPDGGMC